MSDIRVSYLTYVIRDRPLHGDDPKPKTHMSSNGHYCGVMESELERECQDHSDSFDCPDCIVYFSKGLGEYRALVHDGGSSYSVINYCLWCGSRLPTARQVE